MSLIKFLKQNKVLKKFLSIFFKINPSIYWKYLSSGPKNYNFTRFSYDELFLTFFKNKEVENIFEVGCGYGDRLFFLRNLNIKKLYGIDINKKRINTGSEILKKNNITNIELEYSDINFYNLPENLKFDYIISSMTLIYLNKEELKKFFKKYSIFVNKGFLLQEFHSHDLTSDDTFYNHNFKKVFKELNLDKEYYFEFDKIDYEPWLNKKSKPYFIKILRNQTSL